MPSKGRQPPCLPQEKSTHLNEAPYQKQDKKNSGQGKSPES